MIELHAIISGRVQGIGFRWTVQDHARTFSLSGTVANLPDGTVEIYAVGEKAELEQFIRAIKAEPGFAKITKVKVSYSKATQSYVGFAIVH